MRDEMRPVPSRRMPLEPFAVGDKVRITANIVPFRGKVAVVEKVILISRGGPGWDIGVRLEGRRVLVWFDPSKLEKIDDEVDSSQ